MHHKQIHASPVASLIAALVIIFIPILAGCGAGGGGNTGMSANATVTVMASATPVPVPSPFTEVTENNNEVASSEEIASLQPGQIIVMRVNFEGYKVVEVPCIWLQLASIPGVNHPVFWCHSLWQDVGSGFSGSEVFANFGGVWKKIAALAYGWDNNTRDFLAQPVQSMLGGARSVYPNLTKGLPGWVLPSGKIIKFGLERRYSPRQPLSNQDHDWLAKSRFAARAQELGMLTETEKSSVIIISPSPTSSPSPTPEPTPPPTYTGNLLGSQTIVGLEADGPLVANGGFYGAAVFVTVTEFSLSDTTTVPQVLGIFQFTLRM